MLVKTVGSTSTRIRISNQLVCQPTANTNPDLLLLDSDRIISLGVTMVTNTNTQIHAHIFYTHTYKLTYMYTYAHTYADHILTHMYTFPNTSLVERIYI